MFPNATALFGYSSIETIKPGYPTNPESLYFSEFADKNHPWSKNVDELPELKDSKWKTFGTFERGFDYFGDGSFWLIDAPGHCPGNIVGAAHLKNGDWIIMGGDCAHSRYLFLMIGK
jgi:hypothetical protein